MKDKLPKQLKHWFKRAGLRPICSNIARQGFFHYTGYNRQWRIRKDNYLDMSDTDFDRWANSLEMSVPVPVTETAFLDAVRSMLSSGKDTQ